MNSPVFRLTLFGSPALVGEDGGRLSGRPVQRHRIALLALLVLSPTRSLSRDKLLAYLWPERDAEHARLLLNQAVHALRKALGEGVILSAGDELRLGAAALNVDVIAFQEAVALDDPERAAGLYVGPFLDGFFLSEAAEFQRWVERERERLSAAYAKVLDGLAEAAEGRRDFGSAVEWWRLRAAHDPFDSRVALRLMQALEAAGNPAHAIQHAAIHQRLLQEDLGMEPHPQVSELAERLRTEPTAAVHVDEVRAAWTDNGAGRAAEESSAEPGGSAVPPLLMVDAGGSAPGSHRVGGVRKRGRWEARHWATALGLLGFAAVTVLSLASWLRHSASSSLDPQRVVVAPFDNRTGDPSLDPVGDMATDRIAQGLSRVPNVEVVTSAGAFGAAGTALAAAAGGVVPDPVRALAEQTGAGLLVSGGYYLQGDSLQFHVQITDARDRRVLRSLDPITGSPADSRRALEELGRRAAAAVALVLDTRLATLGNLASEPANYEAFHACLEGLDPFLAADWPTALGHFERSMQLDSTYIFPLIHIGYVRFNIGDPAGADSLIHILNGSRERMRPFELAIVDLLSAYVAEDPVASYEAARRAAAIGPGSPPNVQWGAEALRLNRPRETIRILSAIDPEAAPIGGWPLYWQSLTGAHHALGNHRQELRAARGARTLYPHEAWPLLIEGRALASRGRLAELEALLRSRRSLPHHREPGPGTMMTAIGHELRVHGHARAAKAWFERAVAWYRSQPAEMQAQAAHRQQLALALLAAQRPDEAEGILHELAAANAEEVSVAGVLGVLAARRGNDAEAERIASRLAMQRRPYRTGERLLWRACIAAERGQLEAAVSLLQEAAGRAAGFDHTHPCLDPLRDDPSFQEFTRPQG